MILIWFYVDFCINILIEDCFVIFGDDCIVVKSGID